MNLWQRMRYLNPARRRAEDSDMQEELQSLAAMAQPGELGNLTQAAEQARETWGWTWLERLGQDLIYALRILRQNPGFTATAVLSLALGIGANTAIFSLMDALMLRWLPVRDPQELVMLQMPGARGPNQSFSYAVARAFAEQHDIFANAAGFSGASYDVGSPRSIDKVPGAWVTGAFYETLGLNPVIGRLLTPDDDQPGKPLVAVISHGYWERQFLRNPGIVGQTVPMNGVPVTIIGVSPVGFVGANVGAVADITMPVASMARVSPDAAPLLGPGTFWLRVIARPKAGMPAPQAQARLAIAWPQIAEQAISPAWTPARRKEMAAASLELVPGGTGYTYLRASFKKPLLVLMAVVALVLLIACANVANLLLARAAARQREIAVRLAIGAGRARIIRQLLTESTLLSLIGAAFGIGLAWLSSRFLVDMISTGPGQVIFDLTPNWHVLAFTCAVAVAAGILFGLVPAFQSTATRPSAGLREDARISRSRSRVLSSLVSVQVALSLVLVIGAGLFLRTLQNLQNLDPGFKSEGVLLVNLEGRRTALSQELLDTFRGIPGVVSVSLSTHSPLSGSTWSDVAVPKGQPLLANDNATFIGAGPHFFETLQTPILLGREFTERDTANNPPVALVNEAYARRFFPGKNAIGKYLSATVRGQRKELEIVGIVRNAKLRGLRSAPPPTVYVSYFQLTPAPGEAKFDGGFPTTLEIRASGSLGQISAALEKELQTRVPNASVDVHPLSAQVGATLAQERMMATLAGGFGALALILACIGLYGLLAYSVARRTKEIGIRIALGARRGRVIRMVVRNALGLVVVGIVLGLPAAWATSNWVKSMLFGLTPTDPSTIAGAALVLAAAALFAAYLPARRAARVDPMTALRHE